MRAGKLRHRVTIQQRTAASPTNYPSGEKDASWTTYLTVWASVEPLSGRELFAAQQVTSDVNVRIRMRYRDGVTAKMRVSFNSKIYDIVAVINREERNVELELLCTEGASHG